MKINFKKTTKALMILSLININTNAFLQANEVEFSPADYREQLRENREEFSEEARELINEQINELATLEMALLNMNEDISWGKITKIMAVTIISTAVIAGVETHTGFIAQRDLNRLNQRIARYTIIDPNDSSPRVLDVTERRHLENRVQRAQRASRRSLLIIPVGIALSLFENHQDSKLNRAERAELLQEITKLKENLNRALEN